MRPPNVAVSSAPVKRRAPPPASLLPLALFKPDPRRTPARKPKRLRGDLAALKGKTALVPSMATAQGRRGPPAALVSLRGDAERAILAAYGLQPELAYGGGQAAALREAYRQFVHLSVAPIGRAVAAELALKLDTPGLAFDWSGLMAADVASKARAFQALTGAGMNTKAAAAAAGLEV